MSLKERKAITGALRLAKKADNKEQITLLQSVFDFDDNGMCQGFNKSKVGYFVWLSEEPDVKD